MFEIYKITLPDGRTYYGQHNQERKKAGGGYYHGTYYGCGLRIKNYYKKYGIAGVKKEILYLCETQEEADRLEIKVISENKDLCCLNLTGGGRGLSTYNAKAYWTPERRRAQSEKAKKDFSRPETKKRHRESLLKAHQTDEYKETRSRISKRTWEEKKEQMVSAIHTSEKRKSGNEKTAKKMRELWKNKEWREKTLKEIRKGLNAEKSREKRAASTKKLWEKDGYREKQSEKHKSAWTDDMKQAQRERYGLPVICVETGAAYKSGYEAADAVGLKSRGKVREAARNGTTAGGFHWKFDVAH